LIQLRLLSHYIVITIHTLKLIQVLLLVHKILLLDFGPEFSFLNPNFQTNLTGYTANSVKLLCQMVSGDTQPNPILWREIDITSAMTLTNGCVTVSGMTGNNIPNF